MNSGPLSVLIPKGFPYSSIVRCSISVKGYICHNFGQKVPIDEVLTANKQIHPTIVFTAFTNRISEKRFEQITNVLVHMSETSKVLVTGSQLMHLDSLIAKELIQLKQISDLNSII